MLRRRNVEVFSLSFLDCICCGFGAIILLLVLTDYQRPAKLEESRTHLQAQVRDLRQQLQVIRGESDDLERQLEGRVEKLEQERHKLEQLSGDFSSAQGKYSASTQEAAVTNTIESELVAAKQKLSAEMTRLLKDRASRPATEAIAGIPIDSEYIIFVVDTSSSMTANHWDVNLAIMDEILRMYPHVLGLQIMNDQGTYMFNGTKGHWLDDTPEQRAEIRSRAKHWHAFSQSNPVPGMEEAIRTYWAADKRVSLYVLGDEFTGDSIQAALDSIGSLNKLDANGRRPVRIHAIGFPEGPGMSPFTNIRFSALMRLVTEQNNGTFVGLKQ
ncbi:MAG: VWA domain-containing protein [Proteobacteria bacterium]|nr:VWA domain-containing protein [Pseudomonadota bacterium]